MNYVIVIISSLFSFCFYSTTCAPCNTCYIVGGKPAKNYPFYVFVGREGFMCGGTIVAHDVVVTAAHCLYYKDRHRWAENKEVVVLDSDFTKPDWQQISTQFNCQQYHAHPEYNPHSQLALNDIAVIKLKESLDLSELDNAVLSPCSAEINSECGTAIGLGVAKFEPSRLPKVLMETELHLDPNCASYDSQLSIDPGKQLCYGIGSHSGICGGDSGGPLFCRKGAKPKCLLGVASFYVNTCSSSVYPSVFTRAGNYTAWIESFFNSNK